MTFKLLRAGPEDVEQWAQIYVLVGTSPRILLENKDVSPEGITEWRLAVAKAKLAVQHPDIHHLKIVDEETNKIVAVGQWGFRTDAWDIELNDRNQKKIEPQPGTNVALRKRNFELLVEMDERNKTTGNRYHLMDLCTHPEYQGKGLGRRIVTYGTDKADADGVECALAGTPLGVLLYRKCGFVKVDQYELPLEDYGGKGSHIQEYMIRQPQPPK